MQEEIYKCKLCNKDIKLLKNHLRLSHEKMDIDAYFEKTGDQKNYDEFNDKMSLLRKQRSPNCIEFYISKGYTEEDSLKLIEKHRKKLPFRNRKDFRPNQVAYWVKKGFSKKDSKEKVSLFQSNSKESLIEKYGEEGGNRRYNEFIESLNKRKDTEIKNIIEQFGFDEKEAEDFFVKRRIVVSPRREEYWINKGYSKIDAKSKVKEWQMICSPRTKDFWINKGYSKNEAINKVREYQDNNSINSLMIKYDLTFDEALNKQLEFIDKMSNTMINKGYRISKCDKENYGQYFNIVRNLSNRYYRYYKYLINPNNYNRDLYGYHLDHKISIFNGFKNNIDYKIIASPYNLEMLPANDNLLKGIKSSQKIKKLIKEYNKNELNIKIIEII